MKIPLNWLSEFIELPKDVKKLTSDLTMVGHMLDKIETINGQTVLDLELRGNRADCYSIIGIAREVSAIYQTKLKKIKTIPIKKSAKNNINLDVQTNLVKRVGMVEIKNIKITKSPKWLSEKLIAYGIESKNNIVDLTNLVMLETGEPVHAFDLDRIGQNLEIRLAKDGEKITTFQDTTLTLSKNDLVWASGDKILSVAGAIGEKYHSVSEKTKNILLEAANYERKNIRKTVYRHMLLTDAGIRHEKELDPNLVEFAISRFLYYIKKYKWGEFKPIFFDYYPKKINPWKLTLEFNQLKRISGLGLDLNIIKNILRWLNFKIIRIDNDKIIVLVPTYRTDVILEEDLIEEIIRIYGYDKIPAKTLSLEIPQNTTPNFIIQEEKLKESATAVGFDEIISLSFIQEKYKNNDNIELINPPSPDNKYLRSTLFFNLFDNAKRIIDERGNLVQLFEMGKVYLKQKDKYLESRRIGFIYWSKTKNDFIDFKTLMSAFFDKAEIKKPDYISRIFNSDFVDSYILKLENVEIGFGGKHHDLYYLEIDLDSLLGFENKYRIRLRSKYPPQIEDITLTIPEKTYLGEVISQVIDNQPLIARFELIDVYENNYTFNVEYQAKDRTLTNEEVSKIRNKILLSLETKFKIKTKE